jgi:hypothetical protein
MSISTYSVLMGSYKQGCTITYHSVLAGTSVHWDITSVVGRGWSAGWAYQGRVGSGEESEAKAAPVQCMAVGAVLQAPSLHVNHVCPEGRTTHMVGSMYLYVLVCTCMYWLKLVCCSNVNDVNPWLWQFGRCEPDNQGNYMQEECCSWWKAQAWMGDWSL